MGGGAQVWLKGLCAGPSLSEAIPSLHRLASVEPWERVPGTGKGLVHTTVVAISHCATLEALVVLRSGVGRRKCYTRQTGPVGAVPGMRSPVWPCHLLSAGASLLTGWVCPLHTYLCLPGWPPGLEAQSWTEQLLKLWCLYLPNMACRVDHSKLQKTQQWELLEDELGSPSPNSCVEVLTPTTS